MAFMPKVVQLVLPVTSCAILGFTTIVKIIGYVGLLFVC